MIRRILLADDDGDDRDLFEDVFASLPSEEYELHAVCNGEEVISFLEEIDDSSNLPDLIVLDQNMPLKTGKEALEFIRSHENYRDIPVIIYSTYNDRSFVHECEQLGVTAVVSKPDSYEGYVAMINTFLKYSAKPVL